MHKEKDLHSSLDSGPMNSQSAELCYANTEAYIWKQHMFVMLHPTSYILVRIPDKSCTTSKQHKGLEGEEAGE